MCALLGAGCTMDPSTFCWIARRFLPEKEPNADGTAGGVAGSNFGMPHRDFTYLQSYVHPQKNSVKGKEEEEKEHEEESAAGVAANRPPPTPAPALLSVWIPLSDVTSDNGCMMVVPRGLDAHFTKRWAYAHMRPALRGDEEGVTEVRFDLQAAH